MKVSVLVPLYNTNPQHLREMIESILNQSFQDFEFLILNDSPNNIQIDEIVNDYLTNDRRIRYYKNDSNLGISKSRNILLGLSKGEYIAVFDHDDISRIDRLQLEVDYLDTHQEIGVVSSYSKILNSRRIEKYPTDNFEIKKELMHTCCIKHSASLIRKNVLIKNSIQWEDNFSPCEDYMLWIRLMGLTMFHNIPKCLIQYRIHENQTSKRFEIMDDMAERVCSIAWNIYPSFRQSSQWLYLFGFIPIVKFYNRSTNDTRLLLFGLLPIFRLR